MRYVSLEVRIGPAGFRNIEPKTLELHDDLVSFLFTDTAKRTRLGATHACSIDYRNSLYKPDNLKALLEEAYRHTATQEALDLCLVDLTSNPFTAVRDPLLMVMADWIRATIHAGRCRRFFVLLRELPGSEGVLSQQLQNLGQLVQGVSYEVLLLASSGQARWYPEPPGAVPDVGTYLAARVKQLRASPEDRLRSKLVRRLGHFQTHYPWEGRTRCRRYSYYLHDCSEEMRELLAAWWNEHARACHGFLYDLRTNPNLRNVLRSFADASHLKADRIVDVCQDPALGGKFAATGTFALVLDVLDSGITLRRYIEALRGAGIKLHDHILVGVNKSGNVTSTFEGFHVRGLVSAPHEPEPEQCPQCALGLSTSDDAEDPLRKIRSYDLLDMAFEQPWVAEPSEEVPAHVGFGYDLIPNYTKILENHGHWLAYKIHRFLIDGNCPDDWFVVHPDEADSSSLADSLAMLGGPALAIVRVPRSAITDAQSAMNRWDSVVRANSDLYWMQQLRSLVHAGAVIIDVFNASGSTARSLVLLLKHLGIAPCAYFCFVDYNPDGDNSIEKVPKYALYDWYNPRQLRPE